MQKDFSKQLIKGKIAEMIFDQMFRKSGEFTVIPFGYEAIIPELMQYTERAQSRELIDNVRNAPDFALVNHDPAHVKLVEVKFRSELNMDFIVPSALEIKDKWKSVWLFIVTPVGFYFDSCDDIVANKRVTPLSDSIINREIQDEFLGLVNEFIRSK